MQDLENQADSGTSDGLQASSAGSRRLLFVIDFFMDRSYSNALFAPPSGAAPEIR